MALSQSPSPARIDRKEGGALGISDRLSMLLVTCGRQDVLSYGENKHIRIATWNTERGEIDYPTLVPRGDHV